jgi:hypothetical protein
MHADGGKALHLGQQHVAGLDVAVNDTAAVQKRQPARNINGNALACDSNTAVYVTMALYSCS